MQKQLNQYLDLCRAYDAAYASGGHRWNPTCEKFNDAATMLLPTVEQVFKALNSLPAQELHPPSYTEGDETVRAVKQALGILRDREEWSVRLSPQAPTFAADRFHPWIWQAAAAFWDAGQPAAAVESGAKSLTARIQQKSGLTLVDRELAAEVFSAKASSNRVRLWLPGDRATDMWRSRQDGLHNLAMGAYAGIRNVVAHSHEPGWSEQESLEYLAVLSAVARWADEAELVTP